MPKIIESRYWKHTSGRTASLYGSAPWTSTADKPNWSIEVRGWTIAWDDGTIGTGRPAFKTKEEAQEHLDNMAARGLKGGWAMMTM